MGNYTMQEVMDAWARYDQACHDTAPGYALSELEDLVRVQAHAWEVDCAFKAQVAAHYSHEIADLLAQAHNQAPGYSLSDRAHRDHLRRAHTQAQRLRELLVLADRPLRAEEADRFAFALARTGPEDAP